MPPTGARPTAANRVHYRMNYSQLRFSAVVDWVEIQVETIKSTNFQTIQIAFSEALELPANVDIYAQAINANAGGGSCHFAVRIHDVRRHSDIAKCLRKVNLKLPLADHWHMRKIEVAIDAFGDDPPTTAGRFYKFMTKPVSTNRRLYRDYKGSGKAVPGRFDSLARHLAEGWQLGIGNKGDDRYQHIYVKDTDTIKGERQTVEPRARMEIRLGGVPLHDALPYQTPDDWQHCRFERLADYFRLRTLKENLDSLTRTVAEAADQMGERKTRNRKGGGIREYSKATKADPINEAIRQALRNLSNRWKGTGKRGRPAKKACGNSVRINKRNPYKHEVEPHNSNNYISTINNQDDSQGQQAIAKLMHLYDSTAAAMQEHDRINAIMDAWISTVETTTPDEAKS